MKNSTGLLLTGVFTVLISLTAFSQVKSDKIDDLVLRQKVKSDIILDDLVLRRSIKSDTCYYQAPKMTCQQAQLNAQAIVKYPIVLESLALKNDLIRIKENEMYHVKAGFVEERKLYELDKQVLTDSYNRELRRKKRWRFASGVLAIVAGAFYLK